MLLQRMMRALRAARGPPLGSRHETAALRQRERRAASIDPCGRLPCHLSACAGGVGNQGPVTTRYPRWSACLQRES